MYRPASGQVHCFRVSVLLAVLKEEAKEVMAIPPVSVEPKLSGAGTLLMSGPLSPFEKYAGTPLICCASSIYLGGKTPSRVSQFGS